MDIELFLVWAIMSERSCKNLLISLGKITRSEMLGHRVTLCLTF